MTDTTPPGYLNYGVGSTVPIAINENIEFEMSEAVRAGSGFITFTDSDGNTLKVDFTSSAVRFIGQFVIINPPVDLVQGKTYTVKVDAGAIVDLAGNAAPSLSFSVNATAADNTAPTLISTSATWGSGIGVQFSEAIERGSGTVAMHAADGSIIFQYDITDTSHILFAYDHFFVLNSPTLDLTKSYYMTIDAGAITDYSNNAFAGVTTAGALPYPVAPDTTAPKEVSTSPANGATGAATDSAIVITFDEAIIAADNLYTNAYITISNGQDVRSIRLNDSSQVTISGKTLTVKLGAHLAANTTYTVDLPTAAVHDAANNNITEYTFAFSTGAANPTDLGAPQIVSTSPTDNQTNWNPNGFNGVALNFNEVVKTNGGDIEIHSADGSIYETITTATMGASDSGQANLIYTLPFALQYATHYYITMAPGVVSSASGTPFPGFTSSTAYDFTTSASTNGLQLSSSYTDIASTNGARSIYLEFNEPVVAGSGSINLYNSDGSLFESIQVGDTGQVDFTSKPGEVIITPSSSYTVGSKYYVMIGAGVFKDPLGNSYAGISSPSDVPFTVSSTTRIIGEYDIASGTTPNLTSSGSGGALIGYDLLFNFPGSTPPYQSTPASLTNAGKVTVSGSGYTYVYGIQDENSGVFWNKAGASLTVNATGTLAIATAYNITGSGSGAQVTNDGTITVTSSAFADGVIAGSLNNSATGSITVTGGKSARAFLGGSFINKGSITVQGSAAGYTVAVAEDAPGIFDNSGTITANAPGTGVGFLFGVGLGNVTFTNSGTITAYNAIEGFAEAKPQGSTFTTQTVDFTNSGIINGNIQFDDQSETIGRIDQTIHNTGKITGNIYLGWGNDTYDGASGSLAGAIVGGLGDDTIRAGADNDIVYAGLGNNTIDGGGGVNTAVFEGISSDYAVSTVAGTTYLTNLLFQTTTTLTNIQHLDFLGPSLFSGPLLLEVQNLTLDSGKTLSYMAPTSGGPAAITIYANGPLNATGISITNNGTITAESDFAGDSITAFAYVTGSTFSQATLTNNGSILISAPNGTAKFDDADSFTPPFVNSTTGRIIITGKSAAGIVPQSLSQQSVTNNGLIQVTATGTGQLDGVLAVYGGSTVTNTGTITVHGYSCPNPSVFPTVCAISSASTVQNSGIITATSDHDQQNTIAVLNGTLINSGQVSAGIAVYNVTDPYSASVQNTGTITGAIYMGYGSTNSIVNQGTITGDIYFNVGVGSYDGSHGTLNGAIHCGSGADTITCGGGSDIIHCGTGNDMIDGGSNVDTVVLSGKRSAYTITQTSSGNFTVVGPDGTDTLTNIEYLKFDDQTMRLLPGSGTAVNFSSDPSTYMAAIRDFDGNDLGGASSWKLIGTADVSGSGMQEHIFFNRQIGRWAEVGTESDGLTYFDNHGWAGDTRVVGIYIDPLVANGTVVKGSDTDSQRRFQNDLMIDNIHGILGENDYNHDGLQEVYFSLTDGTAYLHAYMWADGNIQYANYQSKQQVIDYLSANGWNSSTWAGWFPAGTSASQTAISQIAAIGTLYALPGKISIVNSPLAAA